MYSSRAILAIAVRYLISFTALFAVWQIVVISMKVPPYILPEPVDVFQTLFAERQNYLSAAAFTLSNMAIGGGIGVALGILVGVVVVYSRTAGWLIDPYLTAFQSFPRESLLPLIIVWLGFGAAPKIVNAAMLSFFPMAVTVVAGLRNVRPEYIELLMSWGATKREIFWHCRLPAIVPNIFAGLKVSLPLALIGAILGEFMGGNNGLGYIINTSGSAFRVDRIFGAIVLLAATGTVIHACLNAIARGVFGRFFEEAS